METIGNFQARLLMLLIYVVVISPIGIIVRLFADPLDIRRENSSSWTDFTNRAGSIESARKQ